MSINERTNDRIVELETRLSFQEDHLQELNKLAVEQANEISVLKKQLLHVVKKVSVLEKSQKELGSSDEPPPHY